MLNRFIVGLVAVADAVKSDRQRREELHRELEERRRLAEEQARMRQEEERRIRLLKEDLVAWRTSREIREYVAAIRAEVSARCTSDEQRVGMDEWLRWVTEHAGRLNPAMRA